MLRYLQGNELVEDLKQNEIVEVEYNHDLN